MLQRTTAAQAPAAAPRPTAQTYSRHSEVGGRLASTEQSYSTIDGRRLKGYVEEITAISRRYRDSGHQFWGRITGTSADAENAQWMMEKFKQNGLSDIHMQPFDLPPQWMAQSWSVNATGKGKTIKVETAQPTYLAVGTPPAGLDLEAVYVAQGSEADIALSKGVRGKAAIFYSTDVTSRHIGIGDNAIKRLEEHGAAAIFIGMNIQGNMRTQFYPVGSKVPTFSLGQGDTLALRDLIAANGSEPTRMKVQLTVQEVP